MKHTSCINFWNWIKFPVWFECCSTLGDFIELLCIKQACGWNGVDLSLSPVWYRQTKLTGSIFICRWHWHFNFTWYCVNNTGSRLRQCAELSLVMLHAPLLQHFRTTYIFAHLVAVFMHDEYIALARLWNLDYRELHSKYFQNWCEFKLNTSKQNCDSCVREVIQTY